MRKLFICLVLIFALAVLAIPQTTKGTFVAKGQGVVRRAAAGVSFPVNGVLDSCVRANEGPPPSSSWTNTVFTGDGAGGMKVAGNVCQSVTAGSAYWNASTFGPDVEVFATLTGDQYGRLFFGMLNIGAGTSDGYRLTASIDGDVLQVSRIDDDVETQLGANITQTVTAGDKFGGTKIGSTISVWYKSGAGAWAVIATRTDGTYNSAGRIGFGGDSNFLFNDFGGGTR